MGTEQKIDTILEKLNKQEIHLAKFLTHQEQHRKELDNITVKIDVLTEFKSSLWGIAISVPIIISAVGLLVHIYLGK